MPFRRLDEQTRLEGHVVSYGLATFESPDGRRFEREIVRHPGAVAVVPLLEDHTVLLVRQFRAATGADLLEIPAGKRDRPGEAPEATASRELVEEIGRRAGRLDELGEFYNSPGFCDEYSHVFLARDLTEVGSAADGIEEEHMEIVPVPLGDVPELIADRVLVDAKSIIGLLLAMRHVGS